MAAISSIVASTAVVLKLIDDDEQENTACGVTKACDDLLVLTAACTSVCRDDRHRIPNYVEPVIPRYLPDNFKRMFRLSRETFEIVLGHLGHVPALGGRQSEGGRPEVPLEKCVLMLLWYIGSQETLKSISDRFDVQESTLIYHNRRLLDVFCSLCAKFIKWPRDCEKQNVIDRFEEKRGFPGVLGAVDGTHIAIKAPGDNEADYINRKGFHSVILQAICKHDRSFIDIYCGWPGRVHDARVYRNSPFFANANALCGQNHIIGDGAYPLSRFLMKPYRDVNLTNAQKQFNKSLCATRSVIENTFGILKGRFRRLQYINMKRIDNIVKTIVTSCILHNICILEQDELDENFQNESTENVGPDGVHAADAQERQKDCS